MTPPATLTDVLQNEAAAEKNRAANRQHNRQENRVGMPRREAC